MVCLAYASSGPVLLAINAILISPLPCASAGNVTEKQAVTARATAPTVRREGMCTDIEQSPGFRWAGSPGQAFRCPGSCNAHANAHPTNANPERLPVMPRGGV